MYHDEGYLRAAVMLEPLGRLEVVRVGRAVVPLILRALPDDCGPGLDAISPYDFSGPALHGELVSMVSQALMEWASARGIVTAFFRFDPLRGEAYAWRGLDGLTIIHSADNIVIEPADPDAMLSRFKPRVGRDRNVAHRAGVVCTFEAAKKGGLDAFVSMYGSSMDRLGATPYYRFPRTFFDAMADAMGERLIVASASVNAEVIATALLLLDEPAAYYYLACSSDAGRKVCAMNLLVFECAVWLNERGFERFHLGGGAERLRHFKERFGPGRAPYFVGRAVFDVKRYAALAAGRSDDFFPAYRPRR